MASGQGRVGEQAQPPVLGDIPWGQWVPHVAQEDLVEIHPARDAVVAVHSLLVDIDSASEVGQETVAAEASVGQDTEAAATA